jgi:hypothetical protein
MIIKIDTIPTKTSKSEPCEFRSIVDDDIREAIDNGIYKFELIDDRYDYNRLPSILTSSLHSYFTNRYYDEVIEKIKSALPGITYPNEAICSRWTLNSVVDYVAKVSKMYDLEERRYHVYVDIKPNYEEYIWGQVSKEIERNREHMERDARRRR